MKNKILDTVEIVDEFEVWKTTSANKNMTYLHQEALSDVEGVELLSPFVAGFMTSPIALFKGKPVWARTKRVDDLRDFKREIEESNDLIFLYQLHWIPSYPYYRELDASKSEPVVLGDAPHIKNGFWLVRYAIN